jgi:hypothetical protein
MIRNMLPVASSSTPRLRGARRAVTAGSTRPLEPRVVLEGVTLGYLLECDALEGSVHSVFARACNVACAAGLATLTTLESGAGPTTILLGQRPDLRALFATGDAVRVRDGMLVSLRAIVTLATAVPWRPSARGAILPCQATAPRLARAAAHLGRWYGGRTGLPSRAASVVGALSGATRRLDGDRARHAVASLVGLGEGLTPAGDDFLAGWLAALDWLALEPAQERFLDEARSATSTLLGRTTPLAAHQLRLAAGGHYPQVLVRLCEALFSEPQAQALEGALGNALACGATSGADTVSGVLAAAVAWCPAPEA